MTKPELGVCYYPEHWDEALWADDARRMAALGLTWVRIAEFAWSRIEPKRGTFQFDWLDRAVDALSGAGLKVVMCTPTATPPKWLVNEMPDMVPVDAEGKPRGFGSRRHYDFSHVGYRKEAERITRIVAERYGRHPAVHAWQTDNEYSCHGTTLSYSQAARNGFQDWLAQKYQSPDALNRAWGNVFWSMEVGDFREVELPNLTVTEPNPAHGLDFRRYASDQVVAFNRAQTAIIRPLSPGRPIIHNFMGRTLDFDHFDCAADLDIASWDSYPIGFLEQFGRDAAWKNWYMRAGDPDFQAFHHDLYRACGKERDLRTQAKEKAPEQARDQARDEARDQEEGRWWVMEQQPGPVNWAPWNPDPHPGMVRLWSHEAFAHGAEVVSYFRWRQAPFAQEQFHAALNRPDNTPDRAYGEIEQLQADLASLPAVKTERAKVALMVDYPGFWALETQPQGANFDAFQLVMDWYSALRQWGQSIDIVHPGSDLDGYALIAVPTLPIVPDGLAERLKASGAHCVVGPRTGSRTQHHQVPNNLPPGPLAQLLGVRVVRVESVRPGVSVPVKGAGAFRRWAEQAEVLDGAETILNTLEHQRPALVQNGRFTTVLGWPDEAFLKTIMRDALRRAQLETWQTGDDLRLRDRGPLRTIVNYGPKLRDAGDLIGKGDRVLVGE
ncbi:MAG: beta-galactosidase, partial [Pseudomonadota bacterium]